jgi:hypothetical protein
VTAGASLMPGFADAVVLTKREVFEVLEACAEAERALLRCGRPVPAARMASLFELLEDRVVLDPLGRPGYEEEGSKSREREFTQ